MPDIKWIKITTEMFDDDKINIIEQLPDADTILIIWIKLLTLAGKKNAGGWIYLTERLTYTDEMLATIFHRNLLTVRLALSTFQKFGMIEVVDNQGIFISNWEKHQNIEGLEKIRQLTRERTQKYRNRLKLQSSFQLPTVANTNNDTQPCDVTVTPCDGTDIDKIRIRKEKEKKEDVTDFNNHIEVWNIVLEQIKNEVSGVNFKTYFERTVGLERRNGQFVIGTPNSTIAEYLRNNQQGFIERVLACVLGEGATPIFIVSEELCRQ